MLTLYGIHSVTADCDVCLSHVGGGGEGRGSHETKFVRNAIQYSEPL